MRKTADIKENLNILLFEPSRFIKKKYQYVNAFTIIKFQTGTDGEENLGDYRVYCAIGKGLLSIVGVFVLSRPVHSQY